VENTKSSPYWTGRQICGRLDKLDDRIGRAGMTGFADVLDGGAGRGNGLRARNLAFPPAGSENHEKHSLLERQESTECARRELDFPAGSKNPEILSLLDQVGEVEDGVEGTGWPVGSGKHKILSLLDGKLRLADGITENPSSRCTYITLVHSQTGKRCEKGYHFHTGRHFQSLWCEKGRGFHTELKITYAGGVEAPKEHTKCATGGVWGELSPMDGPPGVTKKSSRMAAWLNRSS
jgi:hypothetical protein